MSNKPKCSACDELRENAPNLIVNGLGTTECNSLKNDTGLNPSSGNNDCTDLENLNDCLVGNMAAEVDAYDVCDWKEFTKKLIENLWTTLKGIICAICGIWTNIKNLWAAVRKLECLVNYLFTGATFRIGEETDSSKSHIVAGKGVSFLNVSQSGSSTDILLEYIAGGFAKLTGSCKFYTSNFTDAKSCWNYDNNGVNPTQSASRSGYSIWNSTDENLVSGGELVYEVRVKKSEFPQIYNLYTGLGLNSAGGGYHVLARVFYEGQYAWGQHGNCEEYTGDPIPTGGDRGHKVPSGWIYLQVRITYIDVMSGTSGGTQYSPNIILGIKMNQGKIDCD